MADNHVVLLGCGDVGPIHEPLDAFGALVRSTLGAGDIRFAQAERIYSDRGELGSANDHGLLKTHMASIFNDCGFDIVSLASNHSMDFGENALLDTISTMRKNGIQTVGAGRNLQEARQPAIIERNGVRVAFLAYCSVLREGHEAGPSKPGVAPMRAHTRCEPLEYQAGVPPMVITTPYEEDLQAMVEEISKAKTIAHVVVLSLHWGIHYIPRMIADYQPIVAKAAFDAGADLILGHHSHAPKAIGVHSNKVCFYSLGNFIFSTVAKSPEKMAVFARRYSVAIDPDYPNLPQGRDAKRSLIAKAVLAREGVKNVSFLPVLIDRQLRPEVLHHGDPRFNEAIEFMEWVSDGRNHKFSVVGDEVVIT
jgi:hypothetical protein